MNDNANATHGIELLVEKCRDDFRRPENVNHYQHDDYKEAERKFVKYCLSGNTDQ
jgi:hypothetical protein